MENKNIEKNLRTAVESLMPKDGYEKISNKLPTAKKERIIMKNANNSSKFIFSFKKIASIAVAACLVVAVAAFGFVYYGDNIAVASVVDIDVNPSIELTANKKDAVIKAVPLNDDAEKVLDGMELKGTKIDVAVNALIGSMFKNGFLNADTSDILVTVQNSNNEKAVNLKKEIKANIDKALKEKGAKTAVVNQSVTNASSAKDFAEKYNISVGKAILVKKLASLDNSLKAEELAKLSIKEIVTIAKQKGIAGVDFDDDLDDVVEDIIEDGKPADKVSNSSSKPQSNAAQSNTNSDLISKARAKEIALNRAGVKAANIKYYKIELDKDDGIYKYDISFKSGNYEYDLEINAKSGKVLDYDREYDDDRYDNDRDDDDKPVQSTVSSALISKAKAKSIALNHAGVKAADIKHYEIELDKDDGVQKYEISFKSGKYEFDYEINAKTGKILSFDKEIDD